MYLRNFGLQEKPFNITPNPRFVFLSRQHREVFAHLLYGLQSRCGFIEITGEIGAGKTTILRTLFEQLPEQEFRLALIFNPSLSAEELLAAICREYGLVTDSDARPHLLERLNRFLLDENAAGRTVVLVIDEAQNLTAPVLEQIRMLSNLETETDKLIQIVLVGQPELGTLLAQPNLRQLSQRIAVRYHLRPMDRRDTDAYVLHRLRIAGAADPAALVTPAALRALYRASGGLPRLVNVLADRALLAAYSADRRRVDAAAVRVAMDELRRPGGKSGRLAWWGGAALLALAAALAILLVLRRSPQPVTPAAALVPPAPAAPAPAAPLPTAVPGLQVQRLADLRNGLAALGEQESFDAALAALAAACGSERRLFPATPAALERGAAPAPWRWLPYTGDAPTLLAMDAPFLLELRLPAVAGRRFVAVTAGAAMLRVAPDPLGQGMGAAELHALYSGRAWLPWQNYFELAPVTVAGQEGYDVRTLQDLLQQAGDYAGPPTGVYDAATIEAVTRFQAASGIVQDGRVGPLTLMLLYRASGQFRPPRLSDGYGEGR